MLVCDVLLMDLATLTIHAVLPHALLLRVILLRGLGGRDLRDMRPSCDNTRIVHQKRAKSPDLPRKGCTPSLGLRRRGAQVARSAGAL